jgi:signal transduction histidine kinase
MLGLPFLFDILKYTVSGLGVVYAAFYLFKPYLDKSESIQLLELKRTISNQTLPLRLQAHERVVLFIERVNPASLLIRLSGSVDSAAELQAVIINEVRNEFQHNITQQIYVSAHTWAVVKRVKDDTINLVNNAVKAMPPDTSAIDLSKTILIHLSKLEDNPYDAALNLIRQDMEQLY